jgi:hypothetical protein
LISALDGEALVDRLPDHTNVTLVVARPDRLAALLRRADISLIESAPLLPGGHRDRSGVPDYNTTVELVPQ